MEQLLKIKSIPLEWEFNIRPARLEMETEAPTADIRHQPSRLQISHTPARLQMDSYESRASLGLVTALDASQQAAAKGMQASLSRIGTIARRGDMLMDVQSGATPADVLLAGTEWDGPQDADLEMAFLPSVSANISYEPYELSLRFEAERVQFDWRTQSRPDMQFVPASVEYRVTQYPGLEIEYVGGPLYVPPSADPNYEPQFDVKA